MPGILTFKQIQDRVLRRMGRGLNDGRGREEVMDGINEIYTDILSRSTDWRRLPASETVTLAIGISEFTTVKFFQTIDLVYSQDSESIRPMDQMTPAEFKKYIRDNSSIQTSFPKKWMIVGSDSNMHHTIRIYPASAASLDVKIDGIEYLPDLVLNEDTPRLTPDLILALIFGATAYCLDNDEDERADTYYARYEARISASLELNNHPMNDSKPVIGNLEDEYEVMEMSFPKYPFER